MSSVRKAAGVAWALAAGFGILLAWPASGRAQALDPEDFRIRSAQDLVDLCSAGPESEYAAQAIHFCHGYVSGAYQYHERQAAGHPERRIVCPPEPRPSRNQAIAMFLDWARAHPEHMAEPGVEALFRFLVEKYPCPSSPTGASGGSK